MTVLILRVFIIYFLLTVVMRLMGKRQLGELQMSELISTLLLSEVAAVPIADPNLPLVYALIPVAIIFLLEILLPSLFFRFPALRKLVEGTPSVLIDNGKICQKELRKNRITPDEFLAILRTNGVADPSDVSYAILEASGAISVFLYAAQSPPVSEDLNPPLQPPENGIMHILISDGRIKRKTLKKLNMNQKELNRLLSKNKASAADVYLLTIDDAGNTNFVRRSGKEE